MGISLAANGRIAALCSNGRLFMVSKGARHEMSVAPDATALAFGDQVWLHEPGANGLRLRRWSSDGQLLGEHTVEMAGALHYARRTLAKDPSAILGGVSGTFLVRLDTSSIQVTEIRNKPDSVVPARELVIISAGQARVSRARSGRLVSRPDMRVGDGVSLLDGAVVALTGRDSRGPCIDIIGVKRGDFHARLRVEGDVLLCGSENGRRLLIVHQRMLTVFDVGARRDVIKKKLTSAPVAITVDGQGELLAIETRAGELDFIELPAQSFDSRPIDTTVEPARETTARGNADTTPESSQPSHASAPHTETNAADSASETNAAEPASETNAAEPASEASGTSEASKWNIAFRASCTPVTARGVFAGGTFHPPRKPIAEFELRSPFAPDDVIGSFVVGADDIDMAVAAAAGAAKQWRRASVEARAAALRSFDEQLRRRRDGLEMCMVRETGRPRWECAREVRGLSSRLSYTLAAAAGALISHTDEIAPGGTRSRPYGVTAVIGPAMFPLATSHQHIVAALIAGNTVIWKPAPSATATSQIYADAFRASDLPRGVINVVFGGDDIGAALATHAGTNCVVFTGSTAHGRELHAQCAGDLHKKLILHLGAKNPAVVTENATIDLAAYEIATSAYISTGQRCTAISRAYVHRDVVDQFIAKITSICSSLRVGPPTEQAFFGPMLTAERRDRFQAALDSAADEGATVVLRRPAPEVAGYFVEPSIHLVHKPTSESRYQNAELLGPDLAIYPISSLDEGIEMANNSQYGLCSAVFTERHADWLEFTREIQAGIGLLNLGTHSLSGRLPLTGAKASGYGGSAGSGAVVSLQRRLAVQERHSDLVDVWPGTTTPESDIPS